MLLACLTLCGVLAAPPAEASATGRRSYEATRVARVLLARGYAVDPAPEGKRIAFVDVVRQEVFAPDEPFPTFFNLFHWVSRPEVVERELLFATGDAYDPEKIAETSRTLRDMTIFSLVRVVPVKAPTPGEVGVVVYVRDLWSLRLENAFQFTGGQIDALLLQLTERNLFGYGKEATIRFQLAPITWSLGELYIDRRLFGGDLALLETFDVIFNRESNRAEGAVAHVVFERPLYDLGARWGWTLQGDYIDYIARHTQGATVLAVRAVDAEGHEKLIPRVWDQRQAIATAAGRYQFGGAVKHRLSFGGGFSRLDADPNDQTGPLTPAEEAALRAHILPWARTEVFPSVGYVGFTPRYTTFEDLVSFGRAEDVREGPQWAVSARAPLRLLGSTYDAVVGGGGVGYVLARQDTLAEAVASAEGRLMDGELVDRVMFLRARAATPHTVLGRYVLRMSWVGRWDSIRDTPITLGGDNGLRGYPAQAFRVDGGHQLRTNAELRTRPIVWQSVHLGGVLFYDAGSVHARTAEIELHQSVGVGARLLLPQFNRYAYRFDLGVPLDGTGFAILLSGGTQQAVPLTGIEDSFFERSYGGFPAQE